MAPKAAGWAFPVVLIVTLALAGCDTATSSSAGAASPTAAPSPAGVASSMAAPSPVAISTPAPSAVRQCRRLYETWKYGTATSTFRADLNFILSKRGATDVSRMTSVLERAGSVAPRVPLPPQCADPAGYYPQVLATIKTVSHNAGTASGLGHLLMAEAPLTELNKVKDYLNAELTITVGKNA